MRTPSQRLTLLRRLNIKRHGETVIYRRNGYAQFEVKAIAYEPVRDMLDADSPGNNARLFVLDVDFKAAAPDGVDQPATYDEVIVRDVLYKVYTPKHDLGGGIDMDLRKQ